MKKGSAAWWALGCFKRLGGGAGGAEKVDVASSGKVLRPASSNIAPNASPSANDMIKIADPKPEALRL